MKLRNLRESMSIRNLRLKDKVLLSFCVSSILPLLTLVYLLLSFKAVDPEHGFKGPEFVNVNVLLVLVIFLSFLGVSINLNIVKSVRQLVEKTKSIYADMGPDQDQEMDEIVQLTRNFSLIMDRMHEQMGLLSEFEKELTDTHEQIKVSNTELRKLAAEDVVTGLFNRRLFNIRLEEEVKRASRYNHHLCLALLDIDDFKSVNDRFGHQVGDKVLKEMADVLKGSSRAVDILARYGGEEFGIIFPETSNRAARTTMDRLRRNVEKHIFLKGDDGLNLRMTVSVGIASFHGKNGDAVDIVRNADKALNLAKRHGKNRVEEG